MRDFVPLTTEEQAIVKKAAEDVNSSIAIPCTACEYCVDGCPQNIPIPQIFTLYNNQKRFRFVPGHMNYYTNLTQAYGKASDCIVCGQCEEHCPQHIVITEQLKNVVGVFEK
jgi:predicted aldo/keto reductase-like oxidoreductase